MLMKNKPVKQSLRSLEGCSGWGALNSPLQVRHTTLSQLVNMGKGVGMSVQYEKWHPGHYKGAVDQTGMSKRARLGLGLPNTIIIHEHTINVLPTFIGS